VLEHGRHGQEQHATLEDERDLEILQQDEYDNNVQWNAEKVHDGRTSF
jgi:hypothetical protein